MDWTYIDDVLIDAVLSENPVYQNRTTDKPVETGQQVTDHVASEPKILTLECVVTGREGRSAAEKYERLVNLTENKELITVAGALETYEDMVIEELSPVKEARESVTFTITLKKIMTVQSQTIEVELEFPAQDDDSELETRDNNSDDLDEDTSSSALFDLFGGLFGGDE